VIVQLDLAINSYCYRSFMHKFVMVVAGSGHTYKGRNQMHEPELHRV
jgi:hypothetical protein